MHIILHHDRSRILVLLIINLAGKTISNYYVIKDKRPKEKFILLYEDGVCMGT